MSLRAVEPGLTEAALRSAAGPSAFAAGSTGGTAVRLLSVRESVARGSVLAEAEWLIELAWSADNLPRGSCPCSDAHPAVDPGRRADADPVLALPLPDGATRLCPHLVALGLAVLDRTFDVSAHELDQHRDDLARHTAVEDYIAGLGATALRAVLTELADAHEEVSRDLQLRAAVASGELTGVATELRTAVEGAFTPVVDDDQAWGWDRYGDRLVLLPEADAVLTEIEGYLDGMSSGVGDLAATAAPGAARAAAAVLPALQRAAELLGSCLADDEADTSELADAAQRVLGLLFRAAGNAQPDPVALADWLLGQRVEHGTGLDLPLAEFAAALGEAGLAHLQRSLGDDSKRPTTDRSARRRDPEARSSRWWDLRLELADVQGDVDRAVALLSDGERPRFGAIVARLVGAGRHVEAGAWLDRAVTARATGSPYEISGWGWLPGLPVTVSVSEAVDLYAHLGRLDDAIAVLRDAFCHSAGATTYAHLVEFARQHGRHDDESAWALEEAWRQARRPHGNARALVEIAVHLDDLDGAWAAADAHGAGSSWQALAAASETRAPARAAGLHRAHVAGLLEHADTRVYGSVAASVALIGQLMGRAGLSEEFAAYVGQLRRTFKRRTSLMSALDRAGVPRA